MQDSSRRYSMLPKDMLKAYLFLCLLAFPFLACSAAPSVTVNGTPVAVHINSSTAPTLNIWSKAAPGVELRYEHWQGPSSNEDTVTIVRFDLQHVRLSIGYQPTQPLLLSEWMQKEQATAIINGGYFDQQHKATGLVISHGQTFGASYNGFGGMLAVDEQGHIRLRYLAQQPYTPSEKLQQATQSSPMLIGAGGKRVQFQANAVSARRSIVAMDRQGRLLFIVSPGESFSLDELADLLLKSDLSINVALNLDGGASTGLYMNTASQHVAVDSFAQLPIVIILRSV